MRKIFASDLTPRPASRPTARQPNPSPDPVAGRSQFLQAGKQIYSPLRIIGGRPGDKFILASRHGFWVGYAVGPDGVAVPVTTEGSDLDDIKQQLYGPNGDAANEASRAPLLALAKLRSGCWAVASGNSVTEFCDLNSASQYLAKLRGGGERPTPGPSSIVNEHRDLSAFERDQILGQATLGPFTPLRTRGSRMRANEGFPPDAPVEDPGDAARKKARADSHAAYAASDQARRLGTPEAHDHAGKVHQDAADSNGRAGGSKHKMMQGAHERQARFHKEFAKALRQAKSDARLAAA